MPDSPSVWVIDTCVLIDLHKGGVLRELFRFPHRLVVPDVIVDELREPDVEELLEAGLEAVELSGAQVLEVLELRVRYPRPSLNDLFALVVARSLDALLLTGDKHLRQAAETMGVTVHGTLWVLDEMIWAQILPPQRAAEALRRMLAQGRRLPSAECARRIQAWEGRGRRSL